MSDSELATENETEQRAVTSRQPDTITPRGRPLAAPLGWLAREAHRHDIAIPLVIVAIGVITALVEPRFATFSNLQNVVRQMSVLLVMGVAAALPILAGGLDLSIAGVAAGSGIVLGMILPEHGPLAGITAALGFGAAVGLANGWIIARFSVSPLIVTLGMMSIVRGFSLIFTGGLPIYNFPDYFTAPLGYGSLGPVPIPILCATAVLGVTTMVLRVTKFGRYVYAIGGNERAAFLSGVPVRRHKTFVYLLAGFVAAAGGIMLTGRVAAAQPTAAAGLELEAIGAVIIGGIALTGGAGSTKNIVYGVILLSVLANAMNLLGVSSHSQLVFLGLVLIVAVVVDRLRRQRAPV